MSRPLIRNPYRSQVLSWYRRCIKAAYTVPWETDADALYVLEETRRLFYANRSICDVARIERKLHEVEMRYGLAVHYNIPYPRPFNKTQGSCPESGVAYAAYLDTAYDVGVTPYSNHVQDGSVNAGMVGMPNSAAYLYEENNGTAELEGREQPLDTDVTPSSTLRK